MDTQTFKPREMIPEWRSIANTPSAELAPARRASPNKDLIESKLKYLTQRFVNTGGLDDAIELLEAGAAFGSSEQFNGASNLILSHTEIPRGVELLAKKMMSFDNSNVSHSPNNYERVFQIRALKKVLSDKPRDSLAAIELARLYFISGQYKIAEKCTERALLVSPNNRFILRAASCLWHRTDELDKALHFLRKSSLLAFDPWVQSAEMAVATSLGKQTKVSLNAIAATRGQSSLPPAKTELAASLASLEFHSGKTKQAKKLFQSAMTAPNGNSLAQLRWFQKSKGFAVSVEPIVDIPNAFEARAYDALRGDHIEAAISNSISWFSEQPFQVSAALLSSSLTLAVTAEFNRAFEITETASRVNPRSFGIQNNKLVALCMLKRVREARAVLDGFILPYRAKDSQTPFQFAASGLVAFTEGNFTNGREFYAQAIRTAAANKDGGLVIAALIYYFWQELINGQVSLEEVNTLVVKIDKITEKNHALRKSMKLNWAAFKKRLADFRPQLWEPQSNIPESAIGIGLRYLEREHAQQMPDFGELY